MLSGTERASLRLALAHLRAPYFDGVDSSSGPVGRLPGLVNAKHAVRSAYELLLGHHQDAPFDAPEGVRLGAAIRGAVEGAESWRALRVRAALYIRSVLRADSLGWDWRALAGDSCDEDEMTGGELGRLRLHDDTPYFLVGDRLARPLWLDARGVER